MSLPTQSIGVKARIMITVTLAAAALATVAWLRSRFFCEFRPLHLSLACSFLAAAAAMLYYLMLCRPRAVYLVDYAGFRTPHTSRVPFASFVEHAKQLPALNERSSRFMTRLLERSGLGEETCLPPAHNYIGTHKYCTLDAARAEFELVAFSAIDDLLAKTGIAPDAIDILVVNCSLFCPVPSLVDMIVSKYKLRSDIRSMHLAGMGCSAGLIAVGLARNLLQVAPPGTCALVVSTETITPNYYLGSERAMLLPNCLFRIGGAAALLSTSPAKARFRLKHVVRSLTGALDSSYRCVFQEEDAEGHLGINLNKDLMDIAGDSLRDNITARLVLSSCRPVSSLCSPSPSSRGGSSARESSPTSQTSARRPSTSASTPAVARSSTSCREASAFPTNRWRRRG